MNTGSKLGPWKVGELARLTGVTVRTLHHYDEIGLLVPSQHTDSGHRLYTQKEVLRLQQILAFRHLGFSIEQSRQALDDENFCALQTVKAVRQEIHQRRIEADELDERLEGIECLLAVGKAVSTEQLIEVIRHLTMYEKYLSKEQIAKVVDIQQRMTPERVEELTKVEWPQLVSETIIQLERGTHPSDPKVRRLAQHWQKLIDEKTAGDAGLAKGYGKIIDNEPGFAAEFMQNVGHPESSLPRLLKYVGEALPAADHRFVDSDKTI